MVTREEETAGIHHNKVFAAPRGDIFDSADTRSMPGMTANQVGRRMKIKPC